MATVDPDLQFFAAHPERRYHIRVPTKERAIDRQRGVHVVDECEAEFRSLGDHRRDRRRIILCRVDHRGAPLPDGKMFKIPILLGPGEVIEDDDGTLSAIIFALMAERDDEVMGF